MIGNDGNLQLGFISLIDLLFICTNNSTVGGILSLKTSITITLVVFSEHFDFDK